MIAGVIKIGGKQVGVSVTECLDRTLPSHKPDKNGVPRKVPEKERTKFFVTPPAAHMQSARGDTFEQALANAERLNNM